MASVYMIKDSCIWSIHIYGRSLHSMDTAGNGIRGIHIRCSVNMCESCNLCSKWYLMIDLKNFFLVKEPLSLPEVYKQMISFTSGILGTFCLLLLTSIHFSMICLNTAFIEPASVIKFHGIWMLCDFHLQANITADYNNKNIIKRLNYSLLCWSHQVSNK